MRRHSLEIEPSTCPPLRSINSNHTWTPIVFDGSSSADLDGLSALRLSGQIREVCDTVEEQLVELLITRAPGLKENPGGLAEAVVLELGQREWEQYGCWVYYPWRQSLVHLLAESDFIELRTNRNRNRITPEEQEALSKKTVGIVGLSVGSSYALVLAMERSCGALRLADFDTLELSNMNRIRTGVHSLGLPKGVIAAREIAEIDPFFQVELHLEGLKKEASDLFFQGLDVVCDACDDVGVKALIRWKARELGIPVIMETSDRGMLDVERYDHPEHIPSGFLHGRISEEMMSEMLEASAWNPDYLDLFVDLGQASSRGVQSLQEVGVSLVGWPQLYSDVAAGGAFATQATRKILLGESMPDARLYLALDEQFSESFD